MYPEWKCCCWRCEKTEANLQERVPKGAVGLMEAGVVRSKAQMQQAVVGSNLLARHQLECWDHSDNDSA